MNRCLLFIIITLFTLVKWNMGYTADWCGYNASATIPVSSTGYAYSLRGDAIAKAKTSCGVQVPNILSCNTNSDPTLCAQMYEWYLACINAEALPNGKANASGLSFTDLCLRGYACLSKQLAQTGSPRCFKLSGTSASGATPATANCDQALWGMSAGYTPGVGACGTCPPESPIFVYDSNPGNTSYICKTCADVDPSKPFYNITTQTCQKGATLVGLTPERCQKLYGNLSSQKFQLSRARYALGRCKRCSADQKSALQNDLSIKETCCKLLNNNTACPLR